MTIKRLAIAALVIWLGWQGFIFVGGLQESFHAYVDGTAALNVR